MLKLMPDGVVAPDGRSEPVGRFNYPPETNGFNVWSDAAMSNDVVKVVTEKTTYGVVKILDMSENGHKA